MLQTSSCLTAGFAPEANPARQPGNVLWTETRTVSPRAASRTCGDSCPGVWRRRQSSYRTRVRKTPLRYKGREIEWQRFEKLESFDQAMIRYEGLLIGGKRSYGRSDVIRADVVIDRDREVVRHTTLPAKLRHPDSDLEIRPQVGKRPPARSPGTVEQYWAPILR